ncbi:MAG: hypothetical protein ACPL7L_01265 [bacterium]
MLNSNSNLPGVVRLKVQGKYLLCLSLNIELTLKAILEQIGTHGDTILDLRVERPSLEERFLEIIAEEEQ